MKAIKIDACNQSVTSFEWNSIDDIQCVIEGKPDTVAMVGHMDHVFVVDEDHHYKDHFHGFFVRETNQLIGGNGVVVKLNGLDFDSAEISTDEVEDAIIWLDRRTAE